MITRPRFPKMNAAHACRVNEVGRLLLVWSKGASLFSRFTSPVWVPWPCFSDSKGYLTHTHTYTHRTLWPAGIVMLMAQRLQHKEPLRRGRERKSTGALERSFFNPLRQGVCVLRGGGGSEDWSYISWGWRLKGFHGARVEIRHTAIFRCISFKVLLLE